MNWFEWRWEISSHEIVVARAWADPDAFGRGVLAVDLVTYRDGRNHLSHLIRAKEVVPQVIGEVARIVVREALGREP